MSRERLTNIFSVYLATSSYWSFHGQFLGLVHLFDEEDFMLNLHAYCSHT